MPWFGNNNYLENFLDSIGYPSANNSYRIIGPDQVRYHIPIKFWVYRNDNGIGGPNLVQLQTYIDNLNKFYNVDNNTLIGFYMKCDIGYIDDDDHLIINNDLEAWSLIQNHKEKGCINIHITNELNDAIGVHYRARFFGVDAIFLDQATTDPSLASTIAHEVGHYFELDHTHQYYNKGKCRKEAISRTRTYPFIQFCPFKKGNLSNVICESTGDFLRDTPADPDLSLNLSCNYILTGKTDPWNDEYESPPTGSPQPDPTNMMSYNRIRSCRDVFSRLQIAVMLHSIERGKSKNNRDGWKNLKAEFDEFETDNDPLTARQILLEEVQERNFHQQYTSEDMAGNPIWGQCDVDWVRFIPSCNQIFEIKTFAMAGRVNANTKITVYDASLNQLAQNDNISAIDYFSRLTISLSASQTYFIKVENMSSNVTGYYNLLVSPFFEITGSSPICSTPTSYTIPNLPAGAVVTWSALPDLVNISCNPSCTQPSLTRKGDGQMTLTATITNICGAPYVVTKSNITVGSSPATGTYNSPTNSNEILIPMGRHDLTTFNASCIAFVTNMSVPAGTTISWSGSTDDDVYWLQSGDNVFCNFTQVGQIIILTVSATTSCGTTTKNYRFKCTTTNSCGIQPLRIVIAPNPAKTNMNVSLVQNNTTSAQQSFQKIRIIDKMGGIKQNNQYSVGTKSASVNVSLLTPDVYTIQVFDGKAWYSEKFIKN